MRYYVLFQFDSRIVTAVIQLDLYSRSNLEVHAFTVNESTVVKLLFRGIGPHYGCFSNTILVINPVAGSMY